MADADSLLEAAEFASVFPENAGILFLPLWCLVPVVLHIYAMYKLFGQEYSLVHWLRFNFPEWWRFL